MNGKAVATIGFGEAGAAFACRGTAAYDRKTDAAATREAKRADYAVAGLCQSKCTDR